MSKVPDVVLLRGCGQDELEIQVSGRHDADLFVEIGSVTKTFTATLLHVMAQSGRVSLDDRVSDHLDFDGAGSEMTLRHLAEHTSGLPRLPPGVHFWRRDPYARLGPLEFEAMLRDLPRLVRSAPGSVIEYSNLGYGVLGAALSAVAGTSWTEAIAEHVVDPLHLDESVVLESEVPPDRRLPVVDRRGRLRDTWTLGPLAPAGGLWTTPRTLAEYTRKVLLERAFGEVPVGWQHTDGIVWHNGATRDARVFVGAAPAAERWSVCHGLRRPPHQMDALGLQALQESSP
jgi:serine-type D-Ala-D-Ala carboxypeptidase/endopeptidase